MTEARRRERLLAALAALLSAGILFAPLLGGIPKAYDLPDHLGSTAQVLSGFREGSLYPRWLPDFHDGWGEPTLVFYPPGLYFVAAGVAALAGGDAVTGLFGALALFAAAGALGVFHFVRRIAGASAALVASLLFAGVPYRVFEIYAAGLASAFAAACLLPWAMAALLPGAGAARPVSRAWPLLFAAIVLTNLPTGVIAAYLVALWLAARILVERRPGSAAAVVLGGLWGAAIAAVYLLPAVAEMRFVRVAFAEGVPLYRSNFLFQKSGSWMSEGLQSTFDRMGLFPAVALVLSLGLLEAARRRPGSAASTGEGSSWLRLVACFGLFSLLLVTPLSEPAWRFLPFLRRVNIPWRFLEPLGVAAVSAAAAAIFFLVVEKRLSRVMAVLACGFLLLLAGVCAVFDASISRVNGRMTGAEARSAVERFSRKEMFFPPRDARRPSEIGPRPRVSCDRPCRAEVVSWQAEHREFRVSSDSGVALAVRTYDFPGWRAAVDGRSLAVRTEAGTGGITIAVPPGDHRVSLRFGTTAARTAGAVLSLVALALWFLARGRLPRATRGEPGGSPPSP